MADERAISLLAERLYQVYQCIMQSTPQLELVFLSMSATSCYCCDAEKGVERSQRSEQRTSAAIKAKKNSRPWDMSLPFQSSHLFRFRRRAMSLARRW